MSMCRMIVNEVHTCFRGNLERISHVRVVLVVDDVGLPLIELLAPTGDECAVVD